MKAAPNNLFWDIMASLPYSVNNSLNSQIRTGQPQEEQMKTVSLFLKVMKKTYI